MPAAGWYSTRDRAGGGPGGIAGTYWSRTRPERHVLGVDPRAPLRVAAPSDAACAPGLELPVIVAGRTGGPAGHRDIPGRVHPGIGPCDCARTGDRLRDRRGRIGQPG